MRAADGCRCWGLDAPHRGGAEQTLEILSFMLHQLRFQENVQSPICWCYATLPANSSVKSNSFTLKKKMNYYVFYHNNFKAARPFSSSPCGFRLPGPSLHLAQDRAPGFTSPEYFPLKTTHTLGHSASEKKEAPPHPLPIIAPGHGGHLSPVGTASLLPIPSAAQALVPFHVLGLGAELPWT